MSKVLLIFFVLTLLLVCVSFWLQKKIALALAAIFGGILLMILVLLYIPVKDLVFGVPFDASKNPTMAGEGSFKIHVEVPCNRLYDREIGFRIDPPIPVNGIIHADKAVSGSVRILVVQGEKKLEKVVALSETGWAYSEGGIWSKIVYRYSPMGGVFCENQDIYLEAKDISFDLNEHSVTVYVSRDRRP